MWTRINSNVYVYIMVYPSTDILDPRCELNRECAHVCTMLCFTMTFPQTEEQTQKKILSEIQACPKITSKWSGHSSNDIQDAIRHAWLHQPVDALSKCIYFLQSYPVASNSREVFWIPFLWDREVFDSSLATTASQPLHGR